MSKFPVDAPRKKVVKALQALGFEVLNFVRDLFRKKKGENVVREEEQAWSRASLTLAMHGMEDEVGPDYSESDLEGGLLMKRAG